MLGRLLLLLAAVSAQNTDKEVAREWVTQYNLDASGVYYREALRSWNYYTNITDYNKDVANAAAADVAAFDRAKGEEARGWAWEGFVDQALRREFSKITDLGYSVLPPEDFDRMSQLNSQMVSTYSTAEVCDRPGDSSGACYNLEPELDAIMKYSRDWDELVWAWEGWRNASGRNMPDQYEEYTGILNQAAVLNGYADNGEYWRSWYESEDFRQICEGLWLQLKPLYEQLHAYVRRKLQQMYPEGDFPAGGHIPAHLLGEMFGIFWHNLEEEMRPYPDKPGLDVTDELIAQGYNRTGMFLLAEDFFLSLGMDAMSPHFWADSMIAKPSDRDVVCHASAWDFMNQHDFRIKQCTEIDMWWLVVTHHEMGHIQYFMEYQNQPIKFRDGANQGFNEAIGDVISLSVSTPNHMESIGLLPDGADDPEVDMNFLMSEALKKIAFIPFGYLIDQWRWDLFSGQFGRQEYNSKWWDVRCQYQGVSPPVTRSASVDFDGGAKYHVAANSPYIRYFISYVLQYQFHQAMCEAAGNTNPLHRCDVYQSKEAGDLLRSMMKLGSSQPWPDALEALTGSREMSVQPLVDYFQPLLDWLEVENEGFPIGWDPACPTDSVVP